MSFPGKILNAIEGTEEQHDTVANKRYPYGTIMELADGRRYRYAHVHASYALPRGRPVLSSDDASEKGAFLGAVTLGSNTFTWTSVEAIAADQFADGYILMQGGFVKKVKSNTATSGAASSTIVIYGTHTDATWASGRYAWMIENPYANVISRGQVGATPGKVVGVSLLDATADYCCWIQTKGLCGVISSNSGLGNADAESQLVACGSAGDEVILAAAYGRQIIGHVAGYNVVNWDNENFIMADLCIE